MRYARIQNDVVIEISSDPQKDFHPTVAAMFNTEIADGIKNGATLVNGVWTNCLEPEPPPVIPQPVSDITVSPVEFLLLFLSGERVYIKSIRSADPIVGDFMDVIEHPKLSIINLSLTSTQQAIDYLLSKLVEAAVITEADAPVRRAAILSGTFQ